jgi:hypothetical protein
MEDTVHEVTRTLHGEHVQMLCREHERWQSTSGWRLINAADSCGT